MKITDILRSLEIGEKHVFNLKDHKRSTIDNTKSRLKSDEGLSFESIKSNANNKRILTVTRIS